MLQIKTKAVSERSDKTHTFYIHSKNATVRLLQTRQEHIHMLTMTAIAEMLTFWSLI